MLVIWQNEVGMWMVKPDFNPDGCPKSAVIHLDTFLQAANLIGVYGKGFIPTGLSFTDSLDIFHAYYVNTIVFKLHLEILLHFKL